MKKIIIITAFSIFFITAYSQSDLSSFSYSMGFGTGNMKDYIKPASFRGFTFDYRSLVKENIGVGLDIGWNVFYDEMPDAAYDYKNVTYSGKQWRYSNHFPILGAVNYYFQPGGTVIPHIGLGIGTMYTLQNTDMGTYTFEKDAWHFALRPEVGLIFEIAPGAGFSIGSKYYYGFKAGDLDSQGYFTLNVGFVFLN